MLLVFTLILLSGFASADYYTQTSSTNIQNYDDSMYLHPDFAPKADIFYTPFNAYRTYCDAMSCPITTKIVQVREARVKVERPKLMMVRYPYSYQMSYLQMHARPIAAIYDYQY